MSGKVHKKFRKATRVLWESKFTDTINKMTLKQRLNLAWRIIRKDFNSGKDTEI